MDTATSDMRIGAAVTLGAIALGGAAVMGVAYHQQVVAGWGFAVAMIAGSLLIAALHGYGR
jgi:hypothetical protein